MKVVAKNTGRTYCCTRTINRRKAKITAAPHANGKDITTTAGKLGIKNI